MVISLIFLYCQMVISWPFDISKLFCESLMSLQSHSSPHSRLFKTSTMNIKSPFLAHRGMVKIKKTNWNASWQMHWLCSGRGSLWWVKPTPCGSMRKNYLWENHSLYTAHLISQGSGLSTSDACGFQFKALTRIQIILWQSQNNFSTLWNLQRQGCAIVDFMPLV